MKLDDHAENKEDHE
jgi:uncharacterized protein YpmB